MIFKSLVALTVALSIVSVGSVYAEASLYEILDYDVGYDIENAELLVMNLDIDFTALSLEIVAFDDGYVELNIPRGLLDSTFDGEDDIFFVLIDGTESDYIEVDSNDTTRTLIIPVFANDEEIEIIGTSVLTSEPTAVEIPSWVKNNAGWWSEGLLGDDDFVAGIQYLISNGILVI